MNQLYLDSARLLARIAPLVLVDDTFALQGRHGDQPVRARHAAALG
jgi:hypothetical protein